MAHTNKAVVRGGLRSGPAAPEADPGPKGLHQIAQEARETLSKRSFRREDGEVVLQSLYSAHRVQITAPHDIMDPRTGQIERGRPITLKFEDGFARTTDLEVIHKIKGCDEGEEITVESQKRDGTVTKRKVWKVTGCSLGGHSLRKFIYQPHPRFGIGKDMWDADDLLAAAKTKQIADVAQVLRDTPEVFDAAMKLLEEGDFPLPGKRKQEQGDQAGAEVSPPPTL